MDSIPSSIDTPVMCSFAPSFLPPSSWTVSFVPGAAWHSKDKEKTCSHGA